MAVFEGSLREGGTTNTPPPFVLHPGRPHPSLGSRLSVRGSSWWRLETPNNLSEIRGGGQGMHSTPAPTPLWRGSFLSERVRDIEVPYT